MMPYKNVFKRIRRMTIILTILLGILSGLTSFLFLTFLNFLIGLLLTEEYSSVNPVYILVFVLVILAFVWSRNALNLKMIRLSQTIFWNIRSEVLAIVLKADYEQMVRYKEKIQSALIYDVNTMTQGALNSIQFLTSLVVVITCFVYMSIQSLPLFLITLAVAVLGVGVYLLRATKTNKQFEEARELEDGFMKYFNSLLYGVKEIQLDANKGKAIYNEKIIPIAKRSYENNTKAFTGFLNNQIIGQVLFYVLIALILVYFSVILDLEEITTVNFLFILLYLLGALETIMVLLPGLIQAKVSANKVEALKNELLVTIYTTAVNEANEVTNEFQQINVRNLSHAYEPRLEEKGFQIGPINWQLNTGEITFIYGGNGSGKTTFLYTVLGLLKAKNGSIELDGKEFNGETESRYKSLFSAVFNDFYLFDEFYANENFDRSQAEELLELFEIQGKVEIGEKGFSVTELSTGQRKRLALIAAILEQKPIIVMDEWAADQDPYFRKKFYEEILPKLKAEGFTVLAITHDDRYYRCADRIYKMEFGKLYEETHMFHKKTIEDA
ncbi:MAG: cyclic peptide export ABC transporter [Fluviicola sp.]